MSTIKVNTITNVSGSGSVEAELPIRFKEAGEPSYPSDGSGETHGILFVDSADDALKYFSLPLYLFSVLTSFSESMYSS